LYLRAFYWTLSLKLMQLLLNEPTRGHLVTEASTEAS
jgi:hypothetical protein